MRPFLNPSLLLSLTTLLPAATLTVGPGMMFPDVASALASAAPGDLILVSPGTYGPFVVTIPVTIAGNGGTWNIAQGSGAAIKIGTAGTVAIDGAVINFASLSGPAISIVGCPNDVRLRNVTVNPTANLNGTAARAAIEVSDSADVILESVVVNGSAARSAQTLFPDGANTGVSALRCKDSLFVLRDCTLRGYDAAPGSAFGGDAVRVVTTSLSAPSCWLLANASETLRGGNASGSTGNAGNCLHHLGSASLQAQLCGLHFLQPGTGGALPGGLFAINNDGGLVAPNLGRAIPACVDAVSGTTTAPATVANGSPLSVGVTSFVPGSACSLGTSFGSRYTHPVPGVNGRLLLDPATLTTVGFGTTPAVFVLTIPANPSLVGTQMTYQSTLYAPGGNPGAFMTAPAFVGVR